MRFLVDAQLPPALATWLTDRNHPSRHVLTLSLNTANDRTLWEEAGRSGEIIVTKDEDFVFLRASHPQGPRVVWIRFGNTTNRVLLARMDALFPSLTKALESGEKLVELV